MRATSEAGTRWRWAILAGLILGISGCGDDAPTRPEEFEEFGVFAIRLGGFDGSASHCDGYDASPLSIRMSRLEGTGPTSRILLEVLGTPAEFVIGGGAGTKIAIFNRGGDAYTGGSDSSCRGGDAGRVNVDLDPGSDVTAAEALEWTLSNPLEETVLATRNEIAPIAYYVTRGGAGTGGSGAGTNADVFVGNTLVPSESFGASPRGPREEIAVWKQAFGEGRVYDVTDDLNELLKAEREGEPRVRVTWAGPGRKPLYARVR